MAAFFIDDFSKEKDLTTMNDMSQTSTSPTSEDIYPFYSILDRCGMSVVVDQVCQCTDYISCRLPVTCFMS